MCCVEISRKKIPGLVSVVLWLSTLLMGYILTRTFCFFGLPADCKFFSFHDHLYCAGNLFFLGSWLGWLTRVFSDRRFFKFPWLLIFLSTSPAFSAISEISMFDRSIESDEEMPQTFQFALLAVACVILFFVAWHIIHSMNILSPTEFQLFWISRLIGILAIVAGFILAESNYLPQMHLHHYFIAFTISSIAAFDHPISSFFLAVCTGVFVQGIAAYSADSIVKPGNFF